MLEEKKSVEAQRVIPKAKFFTTGSDFLSANYKRVRPCYRSVTLLITSVSSFEESFFFIAVFLVAVVYCLKTNPDRHCTKRNRSLLGWTRLACTTRPCKSVESTWFEVQARVKLVSFGPTVATLKPFPSLPSSIPLRKQPSFFYYYLTNMLQR